MAKKQIEMKIPSRLDLWLSCELLVQPAYRDRDLDLYVIIGGHIMNREVNQDFMLQLRKTWFKLIIRGLTEEERNELVNK